MDKKTASSLLLATLQSTFLWGCICMVATIVFAVVAVIIHDVRWLLIFAWPFATFAVWEFARAFSKRRAIIQSWTVTAALLAAFLLGWLYWALAPTDTRSLDQAIQLTCDWVQVPARTAEKVHEIQLMAGKGGVPTVQPYLDIKESPTYTYRCRFTNLSSISAANVTADMPLIFEKVIKSEDGTTSGAVVATYTVDTPNIIVGAGQSVDIYLRNRSPFFAALALPTSATGQVVGSDRIQTFKLMPSQRAAFTMPPFERQEPSKPATVRHGASRRSSK